MATISLGPTATDGRLPVTDSLLGSKIPVLIEWDGSAALVHQGNRKVRVPWSKSGEVKTAEGRSIALPSEQEREGATVTITAS